MAGWLMLAAEQREAILPREGGWSLAEIARERLRACIAVFPGHPLSRDLKENGDR